MLFYIFEYLKTKEIMEKLEYPRWFWKRRTKLKDSYYLTLRLTKLKPSWQWDINTERVKRSWEQSALNRSTRMVQNSVKIQQSLTSGIGTLYVKKRTSFHISQDIWKLRLSGSVYLNTSPKTINMSRRKYKRKTLSPWVRQRFLSYDTISIIHHPKQVSWALLKWRTLWKALLRSWKDKTPAR